MPSRDMLSFHAWTGHQSQKSKTTEQISVEALRWGEGGLGVMDRRLALPASSILGATYLEQVSVLREEADFYSDSGE